MGVKVAHGLSWIFKRLIGAVRASARGECLDEHSDEDRVDRGHLESYDGGATGFLLAVTTVMR
jgi:hypothetical protein